MSRSKKAVVKRDLIRFAGAVIISILTIWGVTSPVVDYFIDYQVKRSIRQEAEAKAVAWAARFVAMIPAIKDIITTGRANKDQAQHIRISVATGSVFRFKLFRPNGQLAFVSDKAQFAREGGVAINKKAIEVYKTGVKNISVHDGRKNPVRPDVYVEAYIPALGPSGATIGVIEVYVNATATHTVLSRSYESLSIWLILGCAFVFLPPALALIWRGRWLRLRDRRVADLQRYDQLTGVLNRNILTQEINRAFTEREPDEQIGVLFIDVDHFKQFNDRYGHHVGDEMLRLAAKTAQSCIRTDKDLLGRYGGDEFVVICRRVDRRKLDAIARRIEHALRDAATKLPDGARPTLSIGAHTSRPGETQKAALHAADIAVYEAKRRGRNQVVEYTADLDADKKRADKIRLLIEDAVKNDRLKLYFQAIFAVQSGELAGFEALLRLIDDNGEVISPAEFIPIAERSGKMTELGDWVIAEALEVAKDWPARIFISINLSIAQLQSGNLPQKLQRELARRVFAPARLEIEITESMLIEDQHRIWEQLQQIREIGVKISIDDFGAGNTSVAHFWKFQFDKIKLDRSFLLAREQSIAKYETLLRALAAFARELNLEIVAEGVEFSDELDIIRAIGFDQVQGFLLGRPTPSPALDHIISNDDIRLSQKG
ncbi:MAG: GGDEF and EAL domain-containing protein [Neomegalonema sp.]|nr:GGDEF and EAL domain-containing protein [Neomegalonema sp.]